MCPIFRIIHRAAIINFLQKVMLNRKVNKILYSKHNCFAINGENKLLRNLYVS